MKKIVRLAALLLAGILSLAVFTACSPQTNPKLEDAYIAYLNENADASVPRPVVNDPALRQKAAELLKYIDKDGTIDPAKALISRTVTDNGTVTSENVSVLTEPPTEGRQKAKVIRSVEDINIAVYYDTFGIATRVINGKTYVAYAGRKVKNVTKIT